MNSSGSGSPSREWIEQTNVWQFMRKLGFTDREAFLHYSRENLEEFWDRMVREAGIDWFRRTTACSTLSRGVEWAAVVPRRQAEHRLELSRPPRGERQDGVHLGRRGRRDSHRDVRRAGGRREPARQRARRARPDEGRSRGARDADDPGSGHDSLRVLQARPDRGADLRGFRRRGHRHAPRKLRARA